MVGLQTCPEIAFQGCYVGSSTIITTVSVIETQVQVTSAIRQFIISYLKLS